MKVKVTITGTFEMELDPENYPEDTQTPVAMMEFEQEQFADDPINHLELIPPENLTMKMEEI